MKKQTRWLCCALIAAVVLTAQAGLATAAPTAKEILQTAGVKGGLVVHVGCGEGGLTAALRVNDSYLVHGLDVDAANVAAARKHIQSRSLGGVVSVDTFDGKTLPYVDGVVNLLVCDDLGDIPMDEVRRVLAPRGVALIGGTRTVQPVPSDIDEWTHYMHDASNNAVAHDDRIGPPRHLQWQAGPRWSRHHDHMASVSAMVSARGRMFSIVDEGSRVSPQLPSDWKLIARDAFSGVLLWKRQIGQWHPALWPLKSGPANLPRRLVAVDEAVYATLSIDGPVTAMDAATGKTLREYKDTAGAEEILRKGSVLLVLVNRTPVDFEADLKTDSEKGKSRDSRTTYSPMMKLIWAGIRSKRWAHGDRSIHAFDADSGRPLWSKAGCVLPLTLGADADHAYYHDGEKVVALALDTGKERWTSKAVPVWQGLDGRGLQSWFAPTLVACEGKVLFAGGEKTHMSYMGWGSKDIGQDTMTAFDATTGEKLWTADHPYSGYNSPEDLFVSGGKVWVGNTAKSGAGGRYVGHDLNTGKLVDNMPPTVKAHWFHHRCYRAKATDKYVLSSRTGIEFVDLKTGEWSINHWIRGGCLYGIMPCNGMIYVPPNPCACYPEAMIRGFAAVAAASPSRALPKTIPTAGRLERGPAYSTIRNPKSEIRNAQDWPTYRRDPARSGASPSNVPTALKRAWEVSLGGKLTQPVVADGRLFVADVDTQVIHALDAESGKALWSYIAGGRIDSPPTAADGRLLFGSTSGYVTCLRASDGAVAWRFRAAPIDRRLVAFDQVESAWPVHGTVLVQDGVATFVAGRSMFLDGGMRLCRLDVETGKLLSETVMNDRDPKGEDLQKHIKGLNMPVALPDILASDGEHLFMRSQTMDLEGNRSALGGRTGPSHLFASYGFTDDSWFHRTYWVFGDAYSGGIGGYGNGKKYPSGRILSAGPTHVYAYGRKPSYFRWSSIVDYQLYATRRPGGGRSAVAPAVTGSVAGLHFKATSSLDPTGKPLTIAAWVKIDAPDGTILVRGAQAAGFGLILAKGRPQMLLRANKKTHIATAGKPIGDDWTHVAGVLGADGRMEVYVNGVSAGKAGKVPALTTNPLIAMKVGYDDTHQLLSEPLAPLAGALDDVMLFHRALTGEQIRRLADRGASLTAADRKGQVLHLDFTRGKLRDQSPGGNHAQSDTAKIETVQGPRGEAMLLKQPARPAATPAPSPAAARRGKGSAKKSPKGSGGGKVLWACDVPLMVRAMVAAGDVLFIAGPPDVLDEPAAFQTFQDEATQKALAAQDAALKGKSGAMLHAVAAQTGKVLAEYRLDSPPVFDGLIAAGGKLYMTTVDGRLECLSGK
jgi:outer membrane protein assembly factor BamB